MKDETPETDLTRRALEATALLAAEIYQQEDRLPARLNPSEGALEEHVGISLGPDGRKFGEVVEALRKVVKATPSSAGRKFFNQLFGGRDPVAVMSEMLTVMLNSPMYTFKRAAERRQKTGWG